MKFSVALSDFQKVLAKSLPALPRKSTLPILEHLHFTLEDNNLKIVATDQDIIIMTQLKVDGVENGSVLVPGKRIADLTKAIGDKGDIEFTSLEESFEIEIKTAFGKYQMKGLNSDEYLHLPQLFDSEKPDVTLADENSDKETAYFQRKEINRLAEKGHIAVSNDEFRASMTGVFFQFRGTYVNAVSTDSFRLVKAHYDVDKAAFPSELDIILPIRMVDLLKKVDEDVILSTIATRGKITHIRFDVKDTVYISRVIDEKFPPYESVIPYSHEFYFLVNPTKMLEVLKRVAIFTSTITNQIKINLYENGMQITGIDEDSGAEGNEVIECSYTGRNVSIGFNIKYLMTALDGMLSEIEDDLVKFTFTETNRPFLIKPSNDSEHILMLLMPTKN